MAILPLSSQNKVSSVFDVETFKLTTKGEQARFIVLDAAPHYAYAHYIRVPQGEEIRGGYYVCIGDYRRVAPEGKDPERCAACRHAEPSRDAMVTLPRRRFVWHVARYRTNQAGQVIKPVSLSLQAMVFADDKYGKLTDIHEEYSQAGGITAVDLKVTCTAVQYQQFSFVVAAECLAKVDSAASAQRRELLAQRHPDLEKLLGRPLEAAALEKLVSEALGRVSDTEYAIEAEGLVAGAAAVEAALGGARRPGPVAPIELDEDEAAQLGGPVDFARLLELPS